MSTRRLNEIEMHPTNSALRDANYTLAEEEDIYDKQLQHVIDNPRLYLDSLEYQRIYTVSWKDYRYSTPTIPYKYTKKGKERKAL